MSSNDNVVVVRHLESLANAAKNYALDLFSQNGGGSATIPDVFTGATSNTGGASGIVPAPAAGDDDKFLCGNGEWVTIQSGGGSYPIATSLEAGLMSAEDKQHLDSVFQSSADFADAVLTGVGGKFLPSVSSVSDYMYFKDSNIQFFDSKLQTLFDTVPFTANYSENSMSFLNGRTTVSKTGDGLKNSLVSSMYSEGVSLPSDTSSTTVKLEIYKISETKGFVEARTVGDSHHNTTKVDKYNFYLKDTGQIVLGSADSIVSGGSASVNIYTHWLPSLKNSEIYALVYGKITLSSDNEVCSICSYRFNDDGSTGQSIVGSAASIGTYYYDAPASKTSIFTRTHSYQKTKVSYNNNSIIVRLYNKSSEETPFFTTVERDYNSSKDYTASRYYLWCVHGATKSPAWSKILWCKWAEGSDYEYPMSGFDAEEMVGCYSDRKRTNWYIITCTAGTYPYSATWFNSAFKVWHFDPRTCDIQPCSKTLSQILPDLIL